MAAETTISAHQSVEKGLNQVGQIAEKSFYHDLIEQAIADGKALDASATRGWTLMVVKAIPAQAAYTAYAGRKSDGTPVGEEVSEVAAKLQIVTLVAGEFTEIRAAYPVKSSAGHTFPVSIERPIKATVEYLPVESDFEGDGVISTSVSIQA